MPPLAGFGVSPTSLPPHPKSPWTWWMDNQVGRISLLLRLLLRLSCYIRLQTPWGAA